ncbi:hypothetical protein ABMY26_06535 (plasmid) [Azospirillum sp. HJ39]|uniref:hypothetical protein n=1 Tax=Azospirillum sp. HJ39 TaxID=3159496 RepID=UPI003558E388
MSETPCPAAAAAERARALIQTIRDFDRGTMVHPETTAAEEQLAIVEASAPDLQASSPAGALFLLALAGAALAGDPLQADIERARKLIQSAARFLEPQVPGGKGNLDYFI